MADALLNLHRYEEAELLSQQASEAYEELLDSEDLYTLSALTKLAFALERHSKLEPAEAIRRRFLDGRERVLGPENPDTVATEYALASILHSRMQYEQALVLYRRACPDCRRRLFQTTASLSDASKNLPHLKQ